MKKALFLTIVLCGILLIGIIATSSAQKLDGLCYGPYRVGQDPNKTGGPSVAEIKEDFGLIAKKANNVRTYDSRGVQANCPALAKAAGLNLYAGASLVKNKKANDESLKALIKACQGGATSAIVGNETLYSKTLTEAELIRYIADVKRQLPKKSVTTAETWEVWLSHPKLVETVDYLLVHVHPYWEGVTADKAAELVWKHCAEVSKKYPGKKIVLGETGWPSAGSKVGKAIPSPENQARFLSDFLKLAKKHDLPYFWFEAFDEPWKARQEGPQGASWGLWSATRDIKPPTAKAHQTSLASPIIAGPPKIIFTKVPPSGSGESSWDEISGTVSGVKPSDYYVVIYSGTDHWYIQPWRAAPFTEIGKNGKWSTDIHLGWEYAAFLVKKSYQPETDIYGDLPKVGGGILAKTYAKPK